MIVRSLRAFSLLLVLRIDPDAACLAALDRSLTLANPQPHQLEFQLGRTARGEEPLAFVYPLFGKPDCPEGTAPENRSWLSAEDSTGRVSLLFLGGQELRLDAGRVASTEAGGIASGQKGPVSFRVDARTFMEIGGEAGRPSFDREIIDDQVGEVTGALDYRSYSRFRGDLSLHTPFGILSAAREAAHWGPALFETLTLSQEAVPFYQYRFTTGIGPFRAASLYGDLLIGDNQSYSSENRERRSLYAHRYELGIGSDWLIGVTEQLVLYDMARPYLFAPVFPLFVAKGFLYEENTNGSLAADLSWRTPWSVLVYAEFLLDDLESPASLLTRDYVQNKWGTMAGVHWTRAWGDYTGGVVAEVSHLEPYVYGHFTPRTAQFSNLGDPLGNPAGPDSRNVTAKVYGRKGFSWYAGVKLGLGWKGRGPGADHEDPVPRTPLASRESLQGEGSPDGYLEPEVAWVGSWAAIHVAARVVEEPILRAGIRVFR